MKSAICIVCVMSVALLVPTRASADESAFSVAPAIIESIIKPGDDTSHEVMITNTTNFPLPMKGQAASFVSLEDIPQDKAESFNASAWFTVEPADFILQPRATQKVAIAIHVPADTEPGGHYATVFFTPLIPKEAVSAQTAQGLARIGVLSFIIVPGDITEKGNVELSALPLWQTFGPLSLSSTFHNTGNVHLAPTGHHSVHDWRGREVVKLEYDPGIVLPGTDKPHQVPWNQKIIWGPHTVTTTIVYGSSGEKLTTQPQTIWFVPWPLLGGLILILTLFVKVFIVNRKRLKLAWRVLRGMPVQKGD